MSIQSKNTTNRNIRKGKMSNGILKGNRGKREVMTLQRKIVFHGIKM